MEWCIYHGFKWCLRLTKVLIIQSEEELPGHYLPENNNVNTRLLGLSRCILSGLVSCSTIHSISNRPLGFIPPAAAIAATTTTPHPPPSTSTSPCVTSSCCTGSLTPPNTILPRICKTPFPLPAHFLLFLRGCGGPLHPSTPPPLHPYLVLMSHCEIQADGWGTKG